MKMTFLAAAWVLVASSAFAGSYEEAQATASNFLGADVKLVQESRTSYLFQTQLEDSSNIEMSCQQAVVVDKTTGQVVEFESDKGLSLKVSAADVFVDGLVISICGQ